MSDHAVFQNIQMLLAAAQYIEEHDRSERKEIKVKERGLDHVYALTLPTHLQRKSKTRKTTGSRFTHNELEKNRRAHLRHCLERLKDSVPLGSATSRHTTLGLLNRAKLRIVNLKDTGKRLEQLKHQEMRQQEYLRRHLEQLLSGVKMTYRDRAGHSLSESSTGSSSSSSFSEQDDVDIVGFDGSLTDSDDLSSNGSDESFADGARRLTLTDVL